MNRYIVIIFEHESLNEDQLHGASFRDAVIKRFKDTKIDYISGCDKEESFPEPTLSERVDAYLKWINSNPGEFTRVYEIGPSCRINTILELGQ